MICITVVTFMLLNMLSVLLQKWTVDKIVYVYMQLCHRRKLQNHSQVSYRGRDKHSVLLVFYFGCMRVMNGSGTFLIIICKSHVTIINYKCVWKHLFISKAYMGLFQQ